MRRARLDATTIWDDTVSGWPFAQKRELAGLTEAELDGYEAHCEQRLDELALRIERATGRLEGLSNGLKKKRILLGVGTGLGILGMVGLAVATWGGALALAGGLASVAGLEDYSSDARERDFLRIDLRNLNECVLYYHDELERVRAERQGRSPGA